MHVPQVNLSEEWEMNMTQEQVRNITHLPYYRYSFAAAAGLALAYLFISILCMGGNGLVCYIVLMNRRMRSVTNLFILNLAFSDLLVGIFCVPTTLVDNLITGWPFSQTVCTLSGFIQGVSVSASVFTLVAIAVDRLVSNAAFRSQMPAEQGCIVSVAGGVPVPFPLPVSDGERRGMGVSTRYTAQHSDSQSDPRRQVSCRECCQGLSG
ncbi:Neuropeptide FF receptor 1 [Acipenser ruthenus]|uniref:Neuropeptide FF receptor 1 n=1 Tax=Acipenser ruthenus TaxID=7906 RepID=A0A444UTT8_ACIRT|nr:Neuropeptide FF receptor 1 [Acipenser ruthenus]